MCIQERVGNKGKVSGFLAFNTSLPGISLKISGLPRILRKSPGLTIPVATISQQRLEPEETVWAWFPVKKFPGFFCIRSGNFFAAKKNY